MTPCALSLDVCDPLQRTTCQSSQASSQLSFAVEERHSPWLTAPPLTLIIFYMSNWSGNKMRTREGSNQDARLYPLHRNYWDSLTESNIRAAQWMDFVWNMEYLKSASRLHAFIPRASPKPLGMGLPRTSWVKLNRLRTGVGRFHSSMYKWGAAPSPNCECGASEQTADHIISTCPLHRATKGIQENYTSLNLITEQSRTEAFIHITQHRA